MNSDALKPHSDRLIQTIEQLLVARGYSYQKPQLLAEAVMKQSDFYAKNPEKSTPWHETWCQIAYLAYYLPLNWWRLATAVQRGLQVDFFKDWDHFIDFGSGLGSASLALECLGVEFKAGGGHCIEHAREAVHIHRELHQALKSGLSLQWQHGAPKNEILTERTLAVFSYSYTELKVLPAWTLKCGGIMIVEPATKDDSRRLLQVRETLIKDGWIVAAPCTHQQACPLLHESERDWCHDRSPWQQPAELAALEKHMPIKNGTLPFSYLMLTRQALDTATRLNTARMTGDLQEFKGFAKQLICRGPEREFLSWQKRDFKKIDYPERRRGELVILQDEIPKKGNELRPTSSADIALA